MPLVRRPSPLRLDARMCLSCGYRGEELQPPECELVRCPECGEDLYTRPPRSYAELEGLVAELPRPHRAEHRPGAIRRWLRRWTRWTGWTGWTGWWRSRAG